MIEVAKGLCYLHDDCSHFIILRDVKSSNILLDSDMRINVFSYKLMYPKACFL